MKEPKLFEIRAESDEDDSFRIKAGAGRIFLSLAWLGVVATGVCWAIAKLVLR